MCSGAASLCGLRLCPFLAELNGLNTWANTDAKNACPEAKTREKSHMTAGPEIKERKGCVLLVDRVSCGLKLSGKMWGERSSEIFREMGFFESRAEDDI